MGLDESKIEKLNDTLIKRLAFLLYAQFPFIDRGASSQLPARLRKDVGLPPEEDLPAEILPPRWPHFR